MLLIYWKTKEFGVYRCFIDFDNAIRAGASYPQTIASEREWIVPGTIDDDGNMLPWLDGMNWFAN